MLTTDRPTSPAASPLDKAAALRAERTALDSEITALTALLSREADLELSAELLGDARAQADLAACRDAAIRLPQARRRLDLVQRAQALVDVHARAAERSVQLGYAVSLRDSYLDAIREVRALLAPLAAAHARAYALSQEISDAQGTAFAYATPEERAGAGGYPVPHAELCLVGQLTRLFGPDKYNRTPYQQWLSECDELGIVASPVASAKGGRR